MIFLSYTLLASLSMKRRQVEFLSLSTTDHQYQTIFVVETVLYIADVQQHLGSFLLNVNSSLPHPPLMKAWKYLQTNELPLGRKFVSGENRWAIRMMRKKCRTFYKTYGLYSVKLSRIEKTGENCEAVSDCRDHNQYDMHFLG